MPILKRGRKQDVIVFRGVDGQWRFRVQDARNHKVLASSEGYHNKQDAIETGERFGKVTIEDLD